MASNGALAYGAFELKRSYQKNLGKGLLVAALLHLLIIGGFLLYGFLTKEEVARGTRVIKSLAELGPPPSLTQLEKPQVTIAPLLVTPPTVGIPKPVPNEQVTDVMATQKQLEQTAPVPPTERGDTVVVKIPEEELLPQRGVFNPVEVEPQPINRVKPTYPELARKAGVTGVVYVDILVDKEGKVRDVQIAKPSGANVGFEEAAKEAVEHWTFSPAIQNGKPVPCWATVKVDFQL